MKTVGIDAHEPPWHGDTPRAPVIARARCPGMRRSAGRAFKFFL